MRLQKLFLVNLGFIELSHFDSIMCLLLVSSLFVNLVFDEIVERQDVPRVVSLRFDVTTLSGLETRLREVERGG